MYDKADENTSPAIPTMYRGIRMRSRLEAKWAYFMDGLGWKWEYEPIDLNGWIPDFVIVTPGAPVLVDVKPIFKRDAAIEEKIVRAIGHDNIVSKYEALILAAAPFSNEEGMPCIGWFVDIAADPTTLEDGPYWDEAVITNNPDNSYGFVSLYMHWRDRIGCTYSKVYDARPHDIQQRWNLATNFVQWQARNK